MTAPHTPTSTDRDTAEGLLRLEGYLLWQAELQKARDEAESFARRMPWLTTAQHEEVIHHYAQERIALSKEVLHTVTKHCTQLQDHYTARYQRLRTRLLCLTVAFLLLSATGCWGTYLLSTYGYQ